MTGTENLVRTIIHSVSQYWGRMINVRLYGKQQQMPLLLAVNLLGGDSTGVVETTETEKEKARVVALLAGLVYHLLSLLEALYRIYQVEGLCSHCMLPLMPPPGMDEPECCLYPQSKRSVSCSLPPPSEILVPATSRKAL